MITPVVHILSHQIISHSASPVHHQICFVTFFKAVLVMILVATFFAFSGTAIDKKNRSTYKVFGPLLDKYSFEESKQDGATLKILYEDRMPDLYVEGEEDSIDHIFDRVFSDLDDDTKQRLKKEYVTKEKILEASVRGRKTAKETWIFYTV
jgi:type I site-specific restriction-modification system R (restriction) subunit